MRVGDNVRSGRDQRVRKSWSGGDEVGAERVGRMEARSEKGGLEGWGQCWK